jgi:hypothetical protein
MTTDDFRARCAALIDRMLTQGFVRPIAFAAIASDGLATSGSSETVTGTIPLGVKADPARGPLALYLLPVHLLFVDPQGRVAYGVLGLSGADALRLLP